jgi:bifunctional UDP-N-acetylglucosamine pyrophosphorylase / glucosamine-1-phosphate N-acetyltransferase
VERVLVIPAAGAGSRLAASLPKLLVPVNGRPMIEHVLRLYDRVAQRAVIVVSPGAREQARDALGDPVIPVAFVVQPEPTGMLDAILLARVDVAAASPRRVLITWCDQVAISPQTVADVVVNAAADPAPSLVLPTCRSAEPYVHLARDSSGRITRVLHRREGDEMPSSGESDSGVFDLSAEAYLEWLTEYATAPEIGARTGERNFVPFVAWVAARGTVVSVPCHQPEEAIGINTPGELAIVEAHLRARQDADERGVNKTRIDADERG